MMSRTHFTLANYSLIFLTLFYIIMLGGGNYEQMNITSVIAKAPPKSLAMLQGEYRFSPIKFWITFRPLTILLFIVAIICNWRASASRRKLLLAGFFIDVLTTVATFTYFAPETGKIMAAPFSMTVDANLLELTQRWSFLNTFRLAAFYISGFLLLIALSKPIPKIASSIPS